MNYGTMKGAGRAWDWWHGFYECKKRFVEFMEGANQLLETNKPAYKYPNFPGAGGDTTKPQEVFGKKSQ